MLRTLVNDYFLCEKLCFIQKRQGACTAHGAGNCQGACIGAENCDEYNGRVEQAMLELKGLLPSFAIVDDGRSQEEKSCIWVEEGKLFGMGYLSNDLDFDDMEEVKNALLRYPSNDYVINIICQYAKRNPTKVIDLKQASKFA